MEKSLKNCTPKLVPDAFLTLEITQNNHCMQEILLEIRHYERRSSKSYRKLILIFLLNTLSFNRQRGLELMTSYFSGYKTRS